MAANRRVNVEYKKLQETPLDWAKVSIPDDANVLKWKASLTGPEGTPYDGGVFSLDITIPQEYPFKPPEVDVCLQEFLTFIFFYFLFFFFFF
jgi:ubiquitin-protein ligase